MNQPKFKLGDPVQAHYNVASGYQNGVVSGIEAQYIYRIRFAGGTHFNRGENQVRDPRPSPEEAWEKATMLIGKRGYERYEYCCLDGSEVEDWHKETRHQVYQILGSAGIKIKPKVKADVRRLIEIADRM